MTFARSLFAAFLLTAFQIPAFSQSYTIPIEAFAALPSYSGVKLSPSGTKIGYFRPSGGRQNLVILDMTTGQGLKVPPMGTEKTPVDYDTFYWKTDDLIVVKASMTANRWVFKGKTHETRAVSMHIPSEKFNWLGEPKRKDSYNTQHETIIDLLPDEPNYALVTMDFDLDAQSEVYKVNLVTGERRVVRRGRQGIQHWYTDHNSEIRMGFGYRSGRSERKMRFKNAEGKWINLAKLDWADAYHIVGFTDDPNILYVMGPNEHAMEALYKLDLTEGKLIEQVFSDASIDLDSTFEHPETARVAGVEYTDDFARTKYFDKDFALLQRSMEKALPGMVISILGKAQEREAYMILARSDTNPGDYYIYDRPKRNLNWILSVRNQINSEQMASTKRVDIPVRDGSTIPGYLTLPKGSDGKNLPTIVLPHGGPAARDTAEWDYEAQFYASRGYAVLKPNFRGSTGYGYIFMNKGKKQWGGLMQDDVTDATHWLINEGIASKERICIVGSSYGGYAALMGTIKEPGLYKCAISVNGVADLVSLKRNDKSTLGGRAWIKNMGLEGVDDEQVSPYHRAKDVSAATLLIAAKDDARISYKQSKNLHKRLKKLGKSSEYVELKTGTHYMVSAQARLQTLQATEKFLAKHIGE